MIQVVLTEPHTIAELFPFSETRCAWELRIGYYTIAERWQVALRDVPICVESFRGSHLASYQERSGSLPQFSTTLPTLFIGGHVALAPEVMFQLAEAARTSTKPFLIGVGGHTVGVFVPHAAQSAHEAIHSVQSESLDIIECSGFVVNRLWHAIDHIPSGVLWDAKLLPHHIHPTAVVHPTAVLDTSSGPILLGEGVNIGAFSLVSGPTALGPTSEVKPHANINTIAAGVYVKLGGEVSNVIVQSHSNKAHYGFWGHSYIGSWVNIGAGCTTSNLKNTYGNIRVELPWGVEDTQRTFLGALTGDHVKFAIGLMLTTGTVCGTGANILAEHASRRAHVSFSWGDEMAVIDRLLRSIRRMMSRRNEELGPATEQLLREISSIE
mgnify:CR=1 FL=1